MANDKAKGKDKDEDNEDAPKKLVPPIEKIVIPTTTTKSAKIRWLVAMGYSVAEIANHLGERYQMVRNIATSSPKRAAREDIPDLVVVYRDEIDDIQAIMDHALDSSLKAGRKERIAEMKQIGKSDEGGGDDE